MKRKLSQLFSLILVLALTLSLLPSALAADGDEEETATAPVSDISVTPTANDGHLNFGVPGDLRTLAAENVSLTLNTDSLADALNKVCKTANSGAALDYVSYLSVSATQGTLYDGYNSEGDTGAGVAGISRYYYSDVNANNRLQDIRFVPSPTFSGRAMITYYGYYTTPAGGVGSYAGRIYITVGKQEPGISYSTDGEAVRFSADDFAAYSLAVTGRTFRYVSFTLPNTSYGTLYYNYLDEAIYDSAVTADKRYYRSTTPSVSNVYFVPNPSFADSFLLAFSGVDIAGATVEGQVTITVTAHGPSHTTETTASGPFVYKVKSGRSVTLDADEFEKQTRDKLGVSFNYFRFGALTASSSGTL